MSNGNCYKIYCCIIVAQIIILKKEVKKNAINNKK